MSNNRRVFRDLPSVEDLVKSYRDEYFLSPRVKLSREERDIILELYDSFATSAATTGAYTFIVEWDLFLRSRAEEKAEPKIQTTYNVNYITSSTILHDAMRYEEVAEPEELSSLGQAVVAEAQQMMRDAKHNERLDIDWTAMYAKHRVLQAASKITEEDLKGMQGVPDVYLNVTWTAVTADQVEKVAKFAAELGVPFNLNTQDPGYDEDEDDGELTHG